MAYLDMPNPDSYRQAIRSNVAITYSVTATVKGAPVAGAVDMRPTGGSIVDTTRPGVRRTLNLELAPKPGLFDLLSPIGTTLTVTASVRLSDRTSVSIPMGVFDVDAEKVSEGGGGLSLTAPDKWGRIQRGRFLGPSASYSNVTVVQQLVLMIRDVLGAAEPVNVTTTAATTAMSPQVWDRDRDKAIIDLAKSIGAWVYFDRLGVATIADIPTIGSSADWLLDASASGVLTELDRERSRGSTYNIVAVSSSSTDGEQFPTQYAWDNDPTSPTYAGTFPYDTNGAGAFGIVPYFYDTPLALTAQQAKSTALSILSRVTGLASQVSAGAVPNPAVDAFDTLDVLPPADWVTTVSLRTTDPTGSLFPSTSLYPTSALAPSSGVQVPVITRNTTGAVLERHVADTVTHPLTVGTAQHIDGRSTRADDIGGS